MPKLVSLFVTLLRLLTMRTVRSKLASLIMPPSKAARNYNGNYASWEEAQEHGQYPEFQPPSAESISSLKSGGKDAGINLNAILSGLLLHNKPASVLDFGGGLGVGYFRSKPYLKNQIASWQVVELEDLSEFGTSCFSDDKLSFHSSIDECDDYDFVIFAGVLQLIGAPFDLVRSVLRKKPNVVIIDRTPLANEEFITTQIKKQTQRYPYRVFSQSDFDKLFHDYTLVASTKLFHKFHSFRGEEYTSRVYMLNSK